MELLEPWTPRNREMQTGSPSFEFVPIMSNLSRADVKTYSDHWNGTEEYNRPDDFELSAVFIALVAMDVASSMQLGKQGRSPPRIGLDIVQYLGSHPFAKSDTWMTAQLASVLSAFQRLALASADRLSLELHANAGRDVAQRWSAANVLGQYHWLIEHSVLATVADPGILRFARSATSPIGLEKKADPGNTLPIELIAATDALVRQSLPAEPGIFSLPALEQLATTAKKTRLKIPRFMPGLSPNSHANSTIGYSDLVDVLAREIGSRRDRRLGMIGSIMLCESIMLVLRSQRRAIGGFRGQHGQGNLDIVTVKGLIETSV